jgi:hypothetical protein
MLGATRPDGSLGCYSHVGQHSTAEPAYIEGCRPMLNPEQSDLYKELQGQGYTDINIVPNFNEPDASLADKVSDIAKSSTDNQAFAEAVSQIAKACFEGYGYGAKDYESMDVNALYQELLSHELFTENELVLVTNGWGLNEDTLNTACYARYGFNTAAQTLEDDDKNGG